MTQTESIDAIVRFQAAIALARIATDPDYDRSPGMFIPSSGTTDFAEQTESASTKVISLGRLVGEYANDVTASTTFEIVHRGEISSEASNTSIIPDSIGSSVKDTIPDGEVGETTELTDALQAVVDYARGQGLQEIADRLIELGQQPLDKDEVPLQATTARYFVEYCIARQKQARPLMTVTPAGELDATWKGFEDESQVMRFFPNGSVWVAYKLSRGRGSFEAAAAALQDPDFHYKIPDWA